MTARELHQMFDWQPAKLIKGRYFTTVECDKIFWSLWRDDKEEIKELGVSVRKNDDDVFVASWWLPEDWGQTPTIPTEPPRPVRGVLPPPYDLGEAGKHLKPHQLAAAYTLLVAVYNTRFGLDGTDTGLGKTFVAAAVAKYLELPVMVVCPASVVDKWIDTLIDWFDIDAVFVESYERLVRSGNEHVVRTSKKRGKTTLTTFTWNLEDNTVIIFDEVHKVSGLSSLTSKVFLGAIASPKSYVIGLSATAANSVLNMDALGRALRLHTGDWWEWCLRNGARPGIFGGLEFKAEWPKAAAALRRIHEFVFPDRGCRVRKDEMPDRLESTVIVDVVNENYPKAAQVYLGHIDDAEREDYEKAEEKETEVSALVLHTRAAQRIELGKVSAMVEKTLDLIDEGRSVVVLLNYTHSISMFIDMLPPQLRYRCFTGTMAANKKKAAHADFQANVVKLFIAQTAAGSTAIDLHDIHGGHPRAMLISPGYKPLELIQALGRTDRLGAKTASLQFIVFSSHKIEKRKAKAVQSKLNALSLLNDGDLADVVELTS